MTEYSEKLKDPRWQKKRLEIFERDKWKCRVCAAGDETLHVHHLVYMKGRDPWEIHSGLLITLCSQCHKQTKEDDEDMTATESLMSDIGVLLDYLWKSGFEVPDILPLAEAISRCEKPDWSKRGEFNLEFDPYL